MTWLLGEKGLLNCVDLGIVDDGVNPPMHVARLLFMCPGCGWPHGPTLGPQKEGVYPPRWTYNGNHDAPTFRPSLMVHAGNVICHSFVTDGNIQFLSDCTHAMAGQTVPLQRFTWGD